MTYLTIFIVYESRFGNGLQSLHQFVFGIDASRDRYYIILDLLLHSPNLLRDHCLVVDLLCSGNIGILGISESIWP